MYDGEPLVSNPAEGKTMPGSTNAPVPVLRLTGVTRDGQSVLCHVHGFTPYFYCSAPPGFAETDVAAFQGELDKQLRESRTGRQGFGKYTPRQHVLAVVPVQRENLYGFQFGRKSTFLQIYVAMPNLVTTARTILASNFRFGSQTRGMRYQTYEAKMPFVLRFLIDQDITGCGWVELKAGTYSVRPPPHAAPSSGGGRLARSRSATGTGTGAGAVLTRTSRCQYEVDVVYDSIVPHAPDGEWQLLAPFRILSFDIECAGRKGHFPEPDQDPVIQIANVVTLQGSSVPLVRNVFVLGTCTPIVGADVHAFRTEEEMLVAWSRFVRLTDPDIVSGYNTDNFDVPYLVRRAQKLGVFDEFGQLGRIEGELMTMKETTFQSAAFGKRENIESTVRGRVFFDMLQYMRRNHRMSSYSLNAVSAEFLGEQKEDVHHSIIADLFRGTADDRRRLAVYCLKDAQLPTRLMEKLMVIVNHVEMSRVTGVPLDFLAKRGQQVKVLSMLFRKCRPLGLIIPVIEREGGGAAASGVAYEGATVIDPIKGFYPMPIATLDFASLYPSIMQAHNLCYSTLVAPEDVAKLEPDQVERSPTGDVFVRRDVRRGILPEILEELLAARKRAKKDMESATDPMVRAVQNGRQLALKVSANSVYGFTGAVVGQLPCLAVSSTVTAYGRDMIHATRDAVHRIFTVANGYPADAVVVYGDTDSVMVKFGVATIEEAMKLGKEASERVTELFPKPVKLEFEKVYCPYLLMNKKRYAGLYWTRPEKWDKLDAKGIETVRRDNCKLARVVTQTVLNRILLDKDVDGAIEYAKHVISELLQGHIDISLLIITKSLGKGASSGDYAAKQAHVELAERMRKRDPASAPTVGDRVPFVVIQAAKDTPIYLKSESPDFIIENGLLPDYQHYLKHQLEKPLSRIFEPVLKDVRILFSGEHTRAIAKPIPKGRKSGILGFATVQQRCLIKGCNVPLQPGETTVCRSCRARGLEPVAYRQRLEVVNALEKRFSQLWTQCQRCQGSLHNDVLCSNGDCPIYYMRKKAAKDLDDATETLERFENTTW
jgi:DNA polymerase delta subunit 1